jgi:amino acid transporter
MAGTGAMVAASIGERGTAVIGILTCYLVATSWQTARRRDGRAGRFELAAFAVALACAAVMAAFGFLAAASPTGRFDSLPAAAHFPFAVVMTIAAAGDLNFILRGTLAGRQRIARHLWRMCTALFIAAASFFLGQQDEFPAELKGLPIWFIPPFATLAAMLFWLLRVRFARAWVKAMPRPRQPQASAASVLPA